MLGNLNPLGDGPGRSLANHGARVPETRGSSILRWKKNTAVTTRRPRRASARNEPPRGGSNQSTADEVGGSFEVDLL